jgi:high affinity sulfate transporter 1
MAAVMALLVGGFCLLGGLLRLGFLADLLSRPVLVGYMTGVAVIMIGGQLGKVTGVDVDGDEFIDQVRSFVGGLDGAHWPTVALALAVLVMLLTIGRVAPKFPGALVAVLVATAAVVVFALEARGIRVVGQIPAGLPIPSVPVLPVADLLAMLVPAVGIAVVAFSDNALTGRTFAARKGETIDANAELRALGICNVATGLTHGFPVSSSGSRTALGDAVGSRTQMYSLVALVSVIAVMFLGRGLLENFPMAALGALVVYAAIRLIDIAEFRRLGRFRRSELLLALATTASVLGFGVLYGVLVAIALSILDLLRRVARPHDGVLGLVPGVAGMHDLDDYPDASPVPGLVVYRYDAPLFFANAEDFRERALAAVVENPEGVAPVEWFVLNAEANVEVDLTAVDALDQLRRDLEARGIVFAMARVKQDLRDLLDAAGFVDQIGADHIFMTLPTAVAAFNDRASAPPPV